MQGEPKAKLRGRAGLILLAVTAALIWWGLDRSEPRADWLRVEAPRHAVAGQPLQIRVHLTPLPESARVCADLHWATTRDRIMGCLASGGSQALSKEGGTFDFQIMVTPVTGLRFVAGIIYVSPTGNWPDHTLVAATELIPVNSNPGAQAETRMEWIRLQPPDDHSTGHARTAMVPRLLTALLFLVATVAARRFGQPTEDSPPSSERRWWQILAVLLVGVCLWELFGLETWLAERIRALAQASDLYYPRMVVQKLVISMTGAATVAFLIVVWRARRPLRWLLLSLGLYLLISAVNLVSLHTIDRIADLSWQGVSLVQALKLGCAALTLEGIRRARRP
jgi:hypothetical protein